MPKKKFPNLGKSKKPLTKKQRKAILKAAKLGASKGYGVRLYQKANPRAPYTQIPLDKFRKGRQSLVYLYQRGTKRSMLMARGRLPRLPIATKKYIETFGKGRVFVEKARPKFYKEAGKQKGNWLPIHRFYGVAQKRFNRRVQEFRKEGYKARGAILPLKRYYNPKFEIFSDTIISGNKKVTAVYANVIAAFDYPGQHWISQRHIRIEFPRAVKISDLHKYTERVETLASTALHKSMPKASDVQVLEVNGYIPVEFSIPKKRKRK